MQQRKIPGLQMFINKNEDTREFEAIFVYYSTFYHLIFAGTCARWKKIDKNPELPAQEGLFLLNAIPGMKIIGIHSPSVGHVDEIILQYSASASRSVKQYRIRCFRLKKNMSFQKILEGNAGEVLVL